MERPTPVVLLLLMVVPEFTLTLRCGTALDLHDLFRLTGSRAEALAGKISRKTRGRARANSVEFIARVSLNSCRAWFMSAA